MVAGHPSVISILSFLSALCMLSCKSYEGIKFLFFYINDLAEFLGFIAVKWTLNGSCLSRWLYKFTVDFLFLPFLLSVVPLFLGLGISLCDNHFYYFHFPHPLFKLSFFPHHSLSSTWHFKKKHWHICLFIFLLYTHFFNVLWLCSHTVVFFYNVSDDQWRPLLCNLTDYKKLSGAFPLPT